MEENKTTVEKKGEDNNSKEKETLLMKIKKPENIIGGLLMLPAYVFLEFFLNQFYIVEDTTFITPIFMYLPIIIGIIMIFICYPQKASIVHTIMLLVALFASMFFYYFTYGVEYEGFDGLGYFFIFVPSTAITRLIAFIYYRKIAGKKKQLKFFAMYLLVFVFTFGLGFLLNR